MRIVTTLLDDLMRVGTFAMVSEKLEKDKSNQLRSWKLIKEQRLYLRVSWTRP
jgi:hypothetical protein